jgi:hypothetical protein
VQFSRVQPSRLAAAVLVTQPCHIDHTTEVEVTYHLAVR